VDFQVSVGLDLVAPGGFHSEKEQDAGVKSLGYAREEPVFLPKGRKRMTFSVTLLLGASRLLDGTCSVRSSRI
jgi:hypothetical protein